VIWSMAAKTVILLELTCSWEENFGDAHARKLDKYDKHLVLPLHNDGWKVVLLPFEVGVRGILGQSVSQMLKALGCSASERRSLRERVAATSLLCSYVIYQGRRSRHWCERKPMRKYQLQPSVMLADPLQTNPPTGAPDHPAAVGGPSGVDNFGAHNNSSEPQRPAQADGTPLSVGDTAQGGVSALCPPSLRPETGTCTQQQELTQASPTCRRTQSVGCLPALPPSPSSSC
jgi:hypothetical protein